MATPGASTIDSPSPSPSGFPLPSRRSHTPPVIFVHGFKGSYLLEKNRCSFLNSQVQWLTTLQGLNLTPPPRINLPLTWNGLVQDRDGLVPGPVLTWLLFGFYNVYSTFVSHMEARVKKGLNSKFCCYTWEWRRDPIVAAQGLVAKIKQEAEESGPVQIICHSMGGMVTSLAINMIVNESSGFKFDELKRLIHSVAFVAVPFGAGTAFLEDMTPGTLIHAPVCDAKAMFSFATPLCMFPVLKDEEDGWWGEVDNWVDNKCGLFSAQDTVTLEQKEHLSKVLECAKRVRRNVKSGVTAAVEACLPIAFMVGDKMPTHDGIDYHKCNGSIPAHWQEVPEVPGDGRVALCKALPAYLDHNKLSIFYSDRLHHHILDDVSTVDAILAKLS